MKITKSELARKLQRQETRIDRLVEKLARKGFYDDEQEPKLKVLDQSVFDGLDEKWRFAAVDSDGVASYYDGIPEIRKDHFIYLDAPNGAGQSYRLGGTYDTTDWQNSLIERDKVELTGSDLCRAMLERGDKYISGFGHHYSDAAALDNKFADTVSKHTQCFQSSQNAWDYFVPINNQGEPLTAADVGL